MICKRPSVTCICVQLNGVLELRPVLSGEWLIITSSSNPSSNQNGNKNQTKEEITKKNKVLSKDSVLL